MTKGTISEGLRGALTEYLHGTRQPDLIQTYLFFLQEKFQLEPVLFPREKMIYRSLDEAIETLEKEGKLWRETEIKINFGDPGVNENTKRIYICPFTGKVFGDNTHPNPQDAIYEWVSKCPENTERMDGLRVKRFFVSEDPEVIKNYIAQERPRKIITKKVYSSTLSGKLFNSKAALIQDFKRNYVKRLSLVEVQNQNRFQIEDNLLNFLQNQLQEDKITAFVESLADYEEFVPFVEQWLEAGESEVEEEEEEAQG